MLAVLIAGVLYLTLGREEPTVRVKPATGSAQAMALATEREDGAPAIGRDDAASKQAGHTSKR